jgi:hypothetical protein
VSGEPQVMYEGKVVPVVRNLGCHVVTAMTRDRVDVRTESSTIRR